MSEMKAGRELDAAVAEKVMEWGKRDYYADGERDFDWLVPTNVPFVFRKVYRDSCPHYSTSIEDAWEVVEKLKAIPIPKDWEDCFYAPFPFVLRFTNDGDWEAGWEASYYANECLERANTPALAICRAALQLTTTLV